MADEGENRHRSPGAEAVRWVGSWVQTDRAGHEAFAQLVMRRPRAASLMHILISRMGENNAVVTSQKNLARLLGCHVNTIIRALRDLEADRWIEVRQIGGTGSINAYVVNDRVAWHGPRDGIRHSLFSATVLVSDDEQPDRHNLDELPPLRKFPRVYPDEKQLPSGPGLPPPSEPALPGLEADLPATAQPKRHGEPVAIGQLLKSIAPAQREE